MNIIFFDGVCHLCNGYINFLVYFDSQKKMLYSPLQGKKATEILSAEQRFNLKSILYYKNGKVLEKSTAVIESLSDISVYFLAFKMLYIIPEFIRDFVYDLIAKNRYKLFGKNEFCRIPTAEEKKYLLD